MAHANWSVDAEKRLCICGRPVAGTGALLCYDCDEGTGQHSPRPLSLHEAGRLAAEGDLAQGLGPALLILPSILTREDEYARGYAEVVRLAQWLQLKEAA